MSLGLQPQNRQNQIFWYKFAQKGYISLSDFFTKFGSGKEVSGLHPRAKFHCCGFKMWAYSPKIAKIVIFGTNLPLRKIMGVHRKSWK